MFGFIRGDVVVGHTSLEKIVIGHAVGVDLPCIL